VLIFLIIFILLAVFVQDLRGRSVYWFWFPSLVILFIIDARLNHYQTFKTQWQSASLCLSFIAIQLLLVTLYFSAKHKQWINISKELLGWGDILFLCSIAFYLSILNYLLFYVSSLFIVCIFWISLKILSPKNNKQIPLAGLQALILIVFLVIQLLSRKVDLTSDNWLLPYIYK